MGDRVQQAASQIDMQPGEEISLQFDSDQPHNHHAGDTGEKHGDAYGVTSRGDGSYRVTSLHTDD